MSEIVIWHNPRCSKSRQALALLEREAHAPVIRRYLDDPPALEELRAAQHMLGLGAIDMMRTKEKLFKELGLSEESSDEELLRAMAQNPVLIERPIVFHQGRAAIGRPTERLLDLVRA